MNNVQEAQAPLPTGTVIHKHYIVESLLGKGDFGNVYLVRDQSDKQELFAFAEVINPAEQEKYRFALDYVSLTPLDQSTLPHVQYVFNDNKLSRTYVLMQYIEEPNLELLRLQQTEKRFPFPEVMALMTPVIHAVAHLHHRHPPVLHGNIQSANIIVPQKVDAPVLVMLDIVKENNATTSKLPYFAPGYAAPEQYKGEFSARTDIYGLGATCYTLITGIVPPDALSRSSQLSKGGSEPLKPVNEVILAIPLFIAEAIQRAMSINADDRFSSVEQFWEALGSPERQSLLSLSHAMPSTPSPALAPMPKLPDTPHPGELNGLRPVASKQADERPALGTPHPEELNGSRSVGPRQADERPALGTPHPEELNGSRPVGPRQADERPAPAPVPKQPRAPRVWRLGTLWPVASKQTVAKPAPAPVPKRSRVPRTPLRVPHARKLGVVFIVLALLISLGIGAGFLSHTRSLPAARSAIPAPTVMRSTPTPTPTATSLSSIYPRLAGTYIGTIGDLSMRVSTSMSLTGIRQSQGNISGYLALGPNMQGSGSFRGTINTAKHVQFIVTDPAGNATLFFEGDMQSENSLVGDYYRCSSAQGGRCSQAPGSYGIWSVVGTS